jgi:heptosyltransferase-2
MKKKILVIRFSSIGDIVLTTPVIRTLKQQLDHGDVEIHYLTKRKFADILAANPYIDQLHSIERKVSEVAEQLKQQQFDTVIDLHNNPRSFQVKRLLQRPSYSVNKEILRRWFYIKTGINLLSGSHIVERYMKTVAPLGVHNDQLGLDYFLRAEDEIDPQRLPASHRQQYIAVVIGGKHQGKLYPEDLVASVCRQLNTPVILLGDKEDQARGEWIAQQGGEAVYNACGQYTLNQSACLIRDAACVITNDTGLMHIAAALKKKIISLWGATVPEFGMTPYLPGPGSQILEAVSSQRPYSRHGQKPWFKKHYNCWHGLEPEKIVAAALGDASASGQAQTPPSEHIEATSQ